MRLTDYQKYRLLEILPGSLTWLTFIIAILLSIWNPIIAIYAIILFDLYWFIRIFYMAVYLVISWKRYRGNMKIDWLKKLDLLPGWQKYYHVLFLPTYKEPYEVLEQTFESLAKVNYPLDKFIVVLAGEERDKDNFEMISRRIKEKYGHLFYRLLITLHPKDISGEIAGKGSNNHYAGQQAQKLVDELNIPYENVIVSTFDIDTQPHPQYFAYLTAVFMTTRNPTRASYQPVAVYNNNLWESNFITRLVSNSTTFWLLTDLARPERLLTFSSHSMSFKALTDVGFWQPDIVTEDTRIFLQCFLYYQGNYRTVPLYIPVSMSTVDVGNFWRSVKNQYKQIRRWAWGVEHLPYLYWNFKKVKDIPIMVKLRYLWNIGEGMYSWATVPIVIFLMGRLPFWFADDVTRNLVLTQTAPYVLQWLMRFSLVGLLLIAVYSTVLLPPRPQHGTKWFYFSYLIQWILVPFSLIFFGSIPAIDAQTRLMIGKYLGFWVSEKKAAETVIH
ncbi:MAG: glycosyltransferase family 2 protein [bacterium]